MKFPRIAIHTGNKVVKNNQHPEWEGTLVLQHNETHATVIRHGPKMTKKLRRRFRPLTTFQSNCEGAYWSGYTGKDFFGLNIQNGIVVLDPADDVEGVENVTAGAIAVEETVRPVNH